MNRLQGEISNIEADEHLIRVEIRVAGTTLYALILNLGPNAGYHPTMNKPCSILFKESEVSICVEGAQHISISNRLPCIVRDVEKEKILSRLKLQCYEEIIFATLSTSQLDRLDVEIGDTVTALVKENEVMLAD